MRYIAFLRGINVGGNNKVDMKTLALSFEQLGFGKVETYINSGNVIFETSNLEIPQLLETIQNKILEVFGLEIKVIIRNQEQIKKVCELIPKSWLNNQEMKTDVMFLPSELDYPEIIDTLKFNSEVENLIYIEGALVWNIEKVNYNLGQVPKFIGSKLYKQITARNINTVRKLAEMLG